MWSLSGDKQPCYKHFPEFSIAPSGETTNQIKKKLWGAKMVRSSSITMPSMVGIVGRAPAVDEKNVMFFCLLTLWNYTVCDNGNAMKQCYFQNSYGVNACRKVCSYAPTFNFFVNPQNFPLGANLY